MILGIMILGIMILGIMILGIIDMMYNDHDRYVTDILQPHRRLGQEKTLPHKGHYTTI